MRTSRLFHSYEEEPHDQTQTCHGSRGHVAYRGSLGRVCTVGPSPGEGEEAEAKEVIAVLNVDQSDIRSA